MARVDPTPVRMSTNLSVDRQTPKTDFGDRINAGLSTAAGVVANGAALAAPFVPGGAIVSAAVSSLNTVGQSRSALTQAPYGGGAAAMPYSNGVPLSGGAGGGPINTTLSGVTSTGGAAGSVGGVPISAGGGLNGAGLGVSGIPGVGSVSPALSGGVLADSSTSLNASAADLGSMLQLQIQIQKESQVFTTVSNVLKTRHETVKNTISNVR